MTLLELILVIATIALALTVTALVMPKKAIPPDDTMHRIANARTAALRNGRPVTVIIQLDSATYAVATAMPDGTVLADSAARHERLTGRPLPPAPDTAGGAVP